MLSRLRCPRVANKKEVYFLRGLKKIEKSFDLVNLHHTVNRVELMATLLMSKHQLHFLPVLKPNILSSSEATSFPYDEWSFTESKIKAHLEYLKKNIDNSQFNSDFLKMLLPKKKEPPRSALEQQPESSTSVTQAVTDQNMTSQQ